MHLILLNCCEYWNWTSGEEIIFYSRLTGVNDTGCWSLLDSLAGRNTCLAVSQLYRTIRLYFASLFYWAFSSWLIYCLLLIILYLKVSLQPAFYEPVYWLHFQCLLDSPTTLRDKTVFFNILRPLFKTWKLFTPH